MMRNREVFANDVVERPIPNGGVAQVVEPHTTEQWDVLRYELETFVCAGEYQRGLDRILSTYLANLGKPTQPAAWVSGFYGSGKSHLVRMLEILWRDAPLRDLASPRDIARLPEDIRALFRELSTISRQYGGLWSAAGTLGANMTGSVRLALLSVVFQSAALPSSYPQARFYLWLMRQEGMFDKFAKEVARRGANLGVEMNDMYVSPYIAESLLAVYPDIAASAADARKLLREQYAEREEISNDEMLATLREVLRLKSTDPAKLPCTLVVLDELQQFIGTSGERSEEVRDIVEACSAQLGSTLLFVGTGQSSLHETEYLAKIQGRFAVQVALSNADVERVVREVVLRKDPVRLPALNTVLDTVVGEIDKQLPNTRIGPTPADAAILAADYPLLPSRQRFWERALRTVDRTGVRGQLRSQLRVAHEAVRAVADDPLGVVIGGDFLYDQVKTDMLNSNMLLKDEYVLIEEQRDGTDDGELRYRACATVYLINKLLTDSGADTGVRATADTLADLLVTDLTKGGTALRQRLPGLLDGLVQRQALMRVGDQYRLQTKEGAEWEGDYSSRATALRGDAARLTETRTTKVQELVRAELKGVASVLHGASRTPRKIDLTFGADAPIGGGGIPVWVRDGGSGVSLKVAREDAQAFGTDGPNSAIVTVFLPSTDANALRAELAGALAASDVLASRGTPNTDAGRAAQQAIAGHQSRGERAVAEMLGATLREAKVLQGGGTEVNGSLAAAVREAAEAAARRRYPEFAQADHAGWEKVLADARDGKQDAMRRVDWEGDPTTHPVCKQVMDSVGAAGKRGRDILKRFTDPPFGWPEEAVQGALVALVLHGALRAMHNGTPVATTKQLTGSAIRETDFRTVTTIITTTQRLAVRGLLTKLGGTGAQGADDAVLATLATQVLGDLRALAHEAGGPPPRPQVPDTAHLDDLNEQMGNDLLLAMLAAQGRLLADRAAWAERRDTIAARIGKWRTLHDLLRHAQSLPVAGEVQPQATAIEEQRTLLNDPDPVPPLCQTLTGTLRTALMEAYGQYERRFGEGMAGLDADDVWRRIPETDRARLIAEQGIHLIPAPAIATETEVIAALGTTPFATWRDRADVLAGRFAQARAKAAQLLTPEAVSVKLPSRTLKTTDEVDAYLAEVRALIMAHIEKQQPVVL